MAKQVIHIGLAVATDGFYPGRSNIVSLAASLGDIGSFATNVLPKSGTYGDSPFWKKHPTEWAEFMNNPQDLATTMAKFRGWLTQWQGNLVACTSSVDFWHLFVAMMETGKDCPFGSQPLDTNSYYAGAEGRKTPIRIMSVVRPAELARQRWDIVAKGKVPEFGPKPKVPKTKQSRPVNPEIIEWRTNDPPPLRATLNRNPVVPPPPVMPVPHPTESFEEFRRRSMERNNAAAQALNQQQAQMNTLNTLNQGLGQGPLSPSLTEYMDFIMDTGPDRPDQ